VLPTGTGKTITFADIVRRRFPGRTLIVAHRQELIHQARDKVERTTGLSTGVEMAEQRTDLQSGLWGQGPTVVVTTVQTQTAGGDGGGRLRKFDPLHFDTLIVDEAHHAAAATYRRIIDYYKANPRLRILGVTATPDRADEQALGQVFESVAYDYEISDAIADGWLVPITQRIVEVSSLDYSEVRTTAGDLNGADLAKVMEEERNLHGIATPCIDLLGRRRAIVFCASVSQAERLAEILNRHRSGMASWVCGKTSDDKRRWLLQQFQAGDIQVMCNCGVLTEGFDDPGVEVIVMGRPTKSRSLYAQMVGRSTRPLPGVVDGPATPDLRRAAIAASAKTACEVMDFVGNAGRHKLVTSADILGGKYPEETVEAATSQARKSQKPVDMEELLARIEAEREAKARAEAATRMRLIAKARYTGQFVNPFDAFALSPVRVRGWHEGKALSQKQHDLLVRQGVNPEGMHYAHAKQVLDEIFRRWDNGLCSYKQARILKQRGIDATNMSKEEASRTLDTLFKGART
jgi:superfamily II DNA or RNA helicase